MLYRVDSNVRKFANLLHRFAKILGPLSLVNESIDGGKAYTRMGSNFFFRVPRLLRPLAERKMHQLRWPFRPHFCKV